MKSSLGADTDWGACNDPFPHQGPTMRSVDATCSSLANRRTASTTPTSVLVVSPLSLVSPFCCFLLGVFFRPLNSVSSPPLTNSFRPFFLLPRYTMERTLFASYNRSAVVPHTWFHHMITSCVDRSTYRVSDGGRRPRLYPAAWRVLRTSQ